MSEAVLDIIKDYLPNNFNQLTWPEQREAIKKAKKIIADYRKNAFEGLSENIKQIQNTQKEQIIDKTPKQLEISNEYRIISNLDNLENSKFLIVSFFTINTPYEKEVRNLISSLEKLNIPYYIEGIRSFGDWTRNTQYKPVVIERALNNYKKPVICIDADAVILSYPKFFEKLISDNIDFSAYFANSMKKKDKILFPDTVGIVSMLLSGTIFFNYSEVSFKILNMWKDRCLQDPSTIDQNILKDCIVALKNEAKIIPLPQSYCSVFDYTGRTEEAVIEHYQASRRNRNTIRSRDNATTKIAIMLPTRKRYESLMRLMTSAYETAAYPNRIYFYLICPKDDEDTLKAVKEINKKYKTNVYIEFEPEDTTPTNVNLSKLWNILYEKASQKSDYFVFTGDDCEFETNSWDAMSIEEMKKHPNLPWMIRYNESRNTPRARSTLFMTNKILHNITGYYMPEQYTTVYMDSHHHDICNDAKCFTFLQHIVLYHHSIILKRAAPDQNYQDKLPGRNEKVNYEDFIFTSKEEKKNRLLLSEKLRAYIKEHSL